MNQFSDDHIEWIHKKKNMIQVSPKKIENTTAEADIYAFPMLMGYCYAYATFLKPDLPSCRGPANAMHGKAATLDHTFKDVITPNADTPYSMALMDLRAEPVVIQVPQVADSYYVWQFEDLYGTLTITIQHQQPQDTAEKANWLPAPEGPFYLVLRIYWPERAALDGTWTPPPVVRLD
jgi:hypothetical protein